SDTLRLSITILNNPVPTTGPCRARIRLENINPPDSFSVTLGEGLMVRPRVVLSATLGGKEGRRYPGYTEVLLNRKPVLGPGESIEKIVTLDVGQLHEDFINVATTSQELEFTGILDPSHRYGEYVAGMSSVYAPVARATRPGLPADKPGIEAL